jgi:putative FmdB family regulatory protein
MPIYEYVCRDCGEVGSKLRSIAERTAATDCPRCGGEAERIISPPRLRLMRKEIRAAHETNERSAHEPRVSNKHQCGAHCHHHKKAESPAALKQASGQKRPWMLGH